LIGVVGRERCQTIDVRLRVGDRRLIRLEITIFAGDDEAALSGLGVDERLERLGELGGHRIRVSHGLCRRLDVRSVDAVDDSEANQQRRERSGDQQGRPRAVLSHSANQNPRPHVPSPTLSPWWIDCKRVADTQACVASDIPEGSGYTASSSAANTENWQDS